MEKVSEKFVEGMKRYLLKTPADSNVMYLSKTTESYEEVDAEMCNGEVACTYINRGREPMRTQVYHFNLSKELVYKSIKNGYADEADIFLMNSSDMSERFVVEELFMLLNSTDIEDEYIYGTGLYMCALYVKDESNMLSKAV